MNEQANVAVVHRHFAAFEQGDFGAALDVFADEVDFQSPVTRTAPKEISWARSRHNREEIAAFFKELGEKMGIERMETLTFTAQGDRVIVEGRNRGTVRSTGRTYEHEWVMVFTLREGKIVRCRHYYDTADLVAAFRHE
jgi:ketosteroid isomerase-like protein